MSPKSGVASPKICYGYSSLVLTRHLDLLLLFHLFLVSLHTAQTFHKFDNFDNSVLSHMFRFVYDFLLTDFDDEKLRPKYFFKYCLTLDSNNFISTTNLEINA